MTQLNVLGQSGVKF